jgi:hypothetical protein
VRSAPGTWRLGARVSWLSLKAKVDSVCVVWPQNHSDGFHWFGLKNSGYSFLQFSLKTARDGFSRFGPQNRQLWFGDLGLKITATVFWFGSQNQAGFGLSVAPQNQRREVGAGHASRSSSLLGVEASLVRVSQSGLKTAGGATMGGARGTIAEVTSGAS